jgi:DNA-binding NarL/FixJ family response regulator
LGIEVVAEAASGRELFAALETTSPDLLLLDIMLPDMSGIEIARKIKANYPEIKILLLSAEEPKKVIEQVLETGVEGYISKSAEMREIEDAIVSVMNGMEYFGRDISKVICEIYSSKKKHEQKESKFTVREMEIIHLCNEGLLVKEIAERLNISPNTVKTHKTNIFQKLGINNSVELAKYMMKTGNN